MPPVQRHLDRKGRWRLCPRLHAGPDLLAEVLDQLGALRNGKGMVVVLIAHAKVEKFEDPESAAYDRYSPRLHKHAAALICEWSDAVLFATRKFRTQTEDAGFNRKRTIANAIGKDGGERILRCVGGPSCIAKNRYGHRRGTCRSRGRRSWRPYLTTKPKEPTNMADLRGFDANQVEPATAFDPIPAGKYLAVITESEMKPTRPARAVTCS